MSTCADTPYLQQAALEPSISIHCHHVFKAISRLASPANKGKSQTSWAKPNAQLSHTQPCTIVCVPFFLSEVRPESALTDGVAFILHTLSWPVLQISRLKRLSASHSSPQSFTLSAGRSGMKQIQHQATHSFFQTESRFWVW